MQNKRQVNECMYAEVSNEWMKVKIIKKEYRDITILSLKKKETTKQNDHIFIVN